MNNENSARVQNKHIARLQARNKVLAEALADERILRKKAYKYYNDRLNSRFFAFWDMYLSHMMVGYLRR